MNLKNQMHKNLVVERHQNVQHGKKLSLILNQSSGEMSNSELAAYCVREIDKYCRGEPTSEKYSVELLRRAIVQREPEAWKWVQQYVSRTIKRFKQTTMLNQ
jgi:hypothetical protein